MAHNDTKPEPAQASGHNESDMPEQPTLADLYQLVQILIAQVGQQNELVENLREEMMRGSAHQSDDIRANLADIRILQRELAGLKVEVEALKAWRVTHEFQCPFVGMTARRATKQQLYSLMEKAFSKDDLDAIIYDLGESPEHMGNGNLKTKVRAIVEYYEHRGRMGDLLALCQRLRPNMTWPLFLA